MTAKAGGRDLPRGRRSMPARSSTYPARAHAVVALDFAVLFAGACLAAFALIGVAVGALWITRAPPDPGGPAAAAWPGEAAGTSFSVAWPALAGHLSAGEPAEPVFVSIRRADPALAPADRPAVLYGRFVSVEASAGAGGLIRRRFRDGSPFEGEDLFVAPPDGRAFWARCPTPARAAGAPGRCLTEMRLGDADVQIRFSPALLPRWETLRAALRERFATGAGSPTR